MKKCREPTTDRREHRHLEREEGIWTDKKCVCMKHLNAPSVSSQANQADGKKNEKKGLEDTRMNCKPQREEVKRQ
jgi:hypothetical protein